MVQGVLALLLTAFVGPSLISPDLANGGLALYLSRPFSRAEYVAGKMTVLLVLLSLITWVPGLLLYAIQASCTGWTWIRPNLWLAGSIVLGPLIWILVLSLIALALSAWVKWRIAAGACVLGLHFVGAGFAEAINRDPADPQRLADQPGRGDPYDLGGPLSTAAGARTCL